VRKLDKNDLFLKLITFTVSVHRVTHELTKNAKSDSISQIQYKMLEYIAVNQPVTPSEINNCQHMSMPNTSRELKKLSDKNLIEKITDSEDRRKQYISLSNDGEAMMNEAFATIQLRLLERIQHASKEELDEIAQALDILQTKLFYD
jgi:MarR family transcriptional regulator, teicoplanin-associated locus regulator